jgi:hypothetical protein
MCLQILDWLVIGVDDGLLSHQIVLQMFYILYQGIEILVIGRVVEDHPMKYFKMKVHRTSSLHQDYSHGIPTCTFIHFKGILQVWYHEHRYLNDIYFQLIKGLLLILPPLETLISRYYCVEWCNYY